MKVHTASEIISEVIEKLELLQREPDTSPHVQERLEYFADRLLLVQGLVLPEHYDSPDNNEWNRANYGVGGSPTPPHEAHGAAGQGEGA